MNQLQSSKITNCFQQLLLIAPILLYGCVAYQTPTRNNWPKILAGASFQDMTEEARIAKLPLYLGAGGKTVTAAQLNYAVNLESGLYNSLHKAGISVQRVGGDVLVILVRGAFMRSDVAEISDDGTDTLKTIAKILNDYDSSYLEIAGYADKMSDQRAAGALTLDMAQRVALVLANYDVKPVRMFVVGRGSQRPIAAQDDIGRLMNRRVELRISPIK